MRAGRVGLLILAALLGAPVASHAKPAREPLHFFARPSNGLALTPPVGWNSWNHFGCHVNAPLIAGNDLAQMSAATRAILTNREVIAVDQDRLGIEGHRAYKHGDGEIWVRPLSGGREAVVLLNRGARPLRTRLKWSELGLPGYLPLRLRDLWRHENLPLATRGVTFTVAPTSVIMLRETPVRPRASD